ncbi:ABC transporter [Candidatus Epulonipiscium fishelsonii]|nr:ABC transporter [Epulopiscium sp. SCG-B05WGA-EpuloA1]
MNIIEIKKLNKTYGKSRGITDIDLEVKESEIFGFIGPNGAGKSTTIRILMGLIFKSSGEATIFGLDIEKDKEKILEDVGYLPSEIFYYDNMKAIELLKYSASFYKVDCKKRIYELAERLNLDLNKKIEDMSLGNRKKVGIIQGLIHSPKLIILDEPTSGLDPLMQQTFFEIIKEEQIRGATILFSSHILSEVQKLCDRVAIIKEGKILKVQQIQELHNDSYKTIHVKTDAEANKFFLEGAMNIVQSEENISFIYKGDYNVLLTQLLKYKIKNIEITEPSLDEIFMHYYDKEA